jgi:integrase/recombinase XerD
MRLEQAVEDYLKIRRRLGFDLRGTQGHLKSFVNFLQAAHAEHVSTELAVRWATQPTDVEPITWVQRLGVVRRFAAWPHLNDPDSEVPPAGLLRARYQRKPRYLYTEEQIERLVKAAKQLRSPGGLRAQTYSTVFGLLAATGLRLSEALRLDCEDVHLTEGMIAIRTSALTESDPLPLSRSSPLGDQCPEC